MASIAGLIQIPRPASMLQWEKVWEGGWAPPHSGPGPTEAAAPWAPQQHCPQGACAPLRMGLDMCPWMVIAPQMGLSQDMEPRADLAVRRLKVPLAPVGIEVYEVPMAPVSVEVCGDPVTLWVWFVGFLWTLWV